MMGFIVSIVEEFITGRVSCLLSRPRSMNACYTHMVLRVLEE